MVATAAFYHLPPRVLPSIHVVEGGRVGTVSHNTDGSDDLGVMQVNTLWLGPIAHATGLSRDAVRWRLIHDACFNIAAGGAILRTYLNQEDGRLMRAVGDYHSHTPARNAAYQALVLDAAGRLFGRR
jgi:soluble lytic murein transglycosylase-like protein